MHLMGLDIGTTGCKAVVFERSGKILSSASREYAVDIPHPSWAEQDPERVWVLAKDAVRQAALEVDGQVAAIGLSVQGEAIMPVDQHGSALRPAILGMDTRTTAQNEWLLERFGSRWIFQKTGMPIHTINTLPKLAWLKEHEPEVWRTADRFLLYEDFIINKLTAQAAISRCLASRTQLYDLGEDRWSYEILDALELSPERLAPVYSSGYVVGEVLAALSIELGFHRAPLVVVGGHDQACGALGVGLVKPGLAAVSTGTAEVVEVALETPALNDSLYQGNLSVYAHVVPGLYVSMTLNHSGGLLLRWYRDSFGELEKAQALETGADAYDLLFHGISDGPTGLLVLPHFSGSGTPYFDTRSKGAVVGLTFLDNRATIAKGILEGLTYELRLNLDMLRTGGVAIDERRAIGGGARSDLWLQLKADITGIPVAVPVITEAASWGAALLAGEGAGCFSSAAQASSDLLRFDRRYYPDPERAVRYDRIYNVYSQLYPLLKDLYSQL